MSQPNLEGVTLSVRTAEGPLNLFPLVTLQATDGLVLKTVDGREYRLTMVDGSLDLVRFS